jgi:uncharacterized protein GlcG (DUF336 family)
VKRAGPGQGLAAAVLGLAWCAAPAAAQAPSGPLTADEARLITLRAAQEALHLGLRATIAVVDAEGTPLALFRMSGAPEEAVVAGQPRRATLAGCGSEGLEGLSLPSALVAITKAGTGAFLSSGGNAFSSRTASFIVQEHFPPAVEGTPGGPLFGVQFSSLGCTDVKSPALPLGLAGDPGGLPLYRNGRLVGGVGVEGDGVYGIDTDPFDDDRPAEEMAALAGTVGFETPPAIRGHEILADGIRLTFVNGAAETPPAQAVIGTDLIAARGAAPSALVPAERDGIRGATLAKYPTVAGSVLSAADVDRVLTQAARQAARTRAAIRRPLNDSARVNVAVVDLDGRVLGFFRSEDAPLFGIDVAVQKGRTAAFFSSPGAGEALRRAGFAAFVRDVPLDGSVAYTSRAAGFLAQPFFPPGIERTDPGPFSTPEPPEWSPFNTGLQLELLCDALESALAGVATSSCTPVPGLQNGITIFPGGVPLYKDGRLAGAIGVSGDGVDQDDLIASAGAAGFDAPAERRCDRLTVRGVRLPYVKFPRHPDL